LHASPAATNRDGAGACEPKNARREERIVHGLAEDTSDASATIARPVPSGPCAMTEEEEVSSSSSGTWPTSSSVDGMEQRGSLQFVWQPVSSKEPSSVLQRCPRSSSLDHAGAAGSVCTGPVHMRMLVRSQFTGSPSSHSSP